MVGANLAVVFFLSFFVPFTVLGRRQRRVARGWAMAAIDESGEASRLR